MNYTNYQKGSEWRKWDLHVHAPSCALNNQFAGSTIDEKWEKYLEKLKSLSDIAVLGITDYFSLDGYKRVIAYKEKGKLENINYILPNIELRMLPVTDSNTPINLHLLIKPELVARIDPLLFSKLEHEYNGKTFNCT